MVDCADCKYAKLNSCSNPAGNNDYYDCSKYEKKLKVVVEPFVIVKHARGTTSVIFVNKRTRGMTAGNLKGGTNDER